MNDGIDKRRFYRFRYPQNARQLMHLKTARGTESVRVVEMSEGGLRFLGTESYEPGEIVLGKLGMYCGRSCAIKGEIGRIQGAETILCGMTGVAFSDVISEQTALIRDFPLFASTASKDRLLELSRSFLRE